MPIYEYQCGKCGHQLEAIQKFSDAPLTECPSCHQDALTKMVSASAFHLKGSGWYVTDIRDKGKPKPMESDATSTSSTETKSTETKPTDNSQSGKAE
jgi:putative FmdB family regulatory protein